MANTTVKVEFIGDAKDLSRAIDGLDKDLSKVGQTSTKASSGFKSFGNGLKKGIPVVGALGAGAGILGVKMFELGNQLDIMNKKAKTVFEDSLPAVQKWAAESSSRMGLTKNEAIGLAASFGDLMKPMGFTAAEASKMSTDVLGLAGALSAWSGGQRTAAEVANSLSKAMLGEREELKSLGISITQEEVNQRVLTNTANGLTFATEQQAQAVATQQLIFEKSTDAQKAWNDKQFEGQDVANELRVKMKELQEEIAIKLYPILLNVGEWLLNTGIPKIKEIATEVQAWWEKQDGLRDAIKKGAEMIQSLIENIIMFIGWIRDAIHAVDELSKKLNSLPDKVFGLRLGLPGSGNDETRAEAERLYGGGRAAGGPVSAGMSYVVGENGPELLTMGSRSGYVHPNGGVTVIVQGSVLSERDLIGVINEGLRRGLVIGG